MVEHEPNLLAAGSELTQAVQEVERGARAPGVAAHPGLHVVHAATGQESRRGRENVDDLTDLHE